LRLIPNIPSVYTSFPDDYINDVRGWGFDRATVEGSAGKLLTLDIDFGSRCSLNCPFCFRRDNSVDSIQHTLQYDDLVQLVADAKELGLKTVKFLGAGEPLENDGILEFLTLLKDMNIIPVIFTKTGILADDVAISRLFSYRGIRTSEELAQFLYDCGASIVLGFNSFDDHIQCEMSGGNSHTVNLRNRSMELLVDIGFTSTMATRLAIGVNPITRANVSEAFNIYKWARLRNIYAIVTPTMISGREKGNAWQTITPSEDKLINLYTDIYRFNLETHLSTVADLRVSGVAAYAGGHPCNQVATGLYVSLNGIVLSCPGSEENVEGNIWNSTLEDIWVNSANYKRGGMFNCHCIAKDGKSIPADLYRRVLEELEISEDARNG